MRGVVGFLLGLLAVNLLLAFSLRQCVGQVTTRSLPLEHPFEDVRTALEAWSDEAREAEDGSVEAKRGETYAILQPAHRGCLLLLRDSDPGALDEAARHFESIRRSEPSPPGRAPE